MPVFTLQWVYAPSDFSTVPPGEQGADAAGNPPFNVVLGIGQTHQTVTINDGNSVFDEIGNAGQTLLNAVTIGGTTYAARIGGVTSTSWMPPHRSRLSAMVT